MQNFLRFCSKINVGSHSSQWFKQSSHTVTKLNTYTYTDYRVHTQFTQFTHSSQNSHTVHVTYVCSNSSDTLQTQSVQPPGYVAKYHALYFWGRVLIHINVVRIVTVNVYMFLTWSSNFRGYPKKNYDIATQKGSYFSQLLTYNLYISTCGCDLHYKLHVAFCVQVKSTIGEQLLLLPITVQKPINV